MKKSIAYSAWQKLPVFILSSLIFTAEGGDYMTSASCMGAALSAGGLELESFTQQPCIAELKAGLGVFFATSPYKQHKNYTYPLPLLDYDNSCFYFHDVNAGFYVFKNEHHQLAAGISYSYLYFDPDETDNMTMKRLNPRHSSLNIDMSYTYSSNWGQTCIKLAYDALGYSDGSSWNISHQYPIMRGRWFIAPGIGIHYESQKKTRYYYGISDRESIKTNLPSYHPDSSYSPYLFLDISCKLSRSWAALLGVHVFFLDDAVKNSPIVDRRSTWTVVAGLKYSF